MSKAISKLGSNKSLSAALLTTLVLTLGISLTGCSSEHEEILAVDRVDQAADIARQLAPKAEDMDFPEVAAAPMPEATTTDMDMAADGTESDGAEIVAADAPATEDLAVNVGAELYNKQCMACHASGLLNAPKYGDTVAWAPRIEKGLETLTMHSAKGFNQMPAQATNGVTEEQIHAAVEYMVDAAS